MIDTGSMRSFVSPVLVQKYFTNYLCYEPFEVVSTHARSHHDQVIVIPMLETFNCDGHHKFYVYDVDRRYDGLIGSDLLKQLKANIDMDQQILSTPYVNIPIMYNAPHELTLEPRTETRVTVPTNLHHGEAIVDYTDFGPGVRMPSAIVSCVDSYAQTVIQNISDQQVTVTFEEPLKVTRYEREEEVPVNAMSNQCEIDELLKQNLQKLRLDHMNKEERQSIQALCYEYRDIFHNDDIPLSFTNGVKHEIRTKNEDPIYIRPYRQPPVYNAEIQKQVDKLLENDVIRESHSPWSAPVHLVPKKTDASGEVKYRMVIDYRRLNEITTDDKYPLPNISELFDKLGKATYFSTIDLASGYHQVEVREEDRQKTAFSTQSGHYEFTRMPFGLKTAPATFQRTMDNVLRGLQGIHCLVYLDDIIIYSSSLQEHIEKLRKVFDRLRTTNLKVTLDKCEFFRKEVLYLGHMITKDGLKPNNDKIRAVLDFPIPKTATEIKSFLGLVGYYRKFIKDFAKITRPLTSCLKKRKKIEFTDEYVAAFEMCKELLVNAPILQFPDFEKPFLLTTDASDFAIGAVLSQGPTGNDKPIAYASRTLNDAETRYSTVEKELLAIVWAVKHFRPYLYGRRFKILTDHRPLAWLNSMKEPNSKLTRWKLRLSEFDYDIEYKNGKQNVVADALSRIKVNILSDDESMKVNTGDQSSQEIEEVMKNIRLLKEDLAARNIEEESTLTISSGTDSVISIPSSRERKSPYSIPSPSSTLTASPQSTEHSTFETDTSGIPILKEAIDTKPNQILVHTWFRNEIAVKDISRPKQKIRELHLPLNRPDLIKQFLKEYIDPKSKYFIYFEDKDHRKQFAEATITLFKKDTVKIMECTERVLYVENEDEQKDIITKYHQGKTCHRGQKETLTRIKRTYFWPNMDITIAAVINACDSCKAMKYDRKPLKPELQLTQTQTKPFEEIFIDIFSIDSKSYLTIVDAFSKIGQALEIKSKTTPEVIRALIKYFAIYGVPQRISADAGAEFNNTLLKETLQFYKIELHISTPHNPNSMGIVERFHSTLIEIYRLAKYENKFTDAASVMTYALMAYNHTIHSATGMAPFEIVFGHTDANNPFNADYQKDFTQKLVQDHKKRTKYLYEYLTNKMMNAKEKIRQKRGGEPQFDIQEGDTIFVKGVNVRRSKDQARYKKAEVTGEIARNVVPTNIKGRETKTAIRDIKRPPQIPGRAHGDNTNMPGTSTTTDRPQPRDPPDQRRPGKNK